MKRNRREHGRILSVETKVRGGSLAADAAAGAGSITVDDAGDFDEDGGWLYIGTQTVEYTACDDDTGIITLADPLTEAAEQGDTVAVWSDLYGEIVDFQEALVELDGEYDNPDPVVAEVAEGVGELPDGDRGKAGESCTLHRVADDEWEVVGVGGRPLSVSTGGGVLFWQDRHTVTEPGSQNVPLTHLPIDNSEHVYWHPGDGAGIYQQGSEWSRSGKALTFPDSEGILLAEDTLTVEYAYRKGVVSSPISGEATFVGAAASINTVAPEGLPLPVGTEIGDLILIGDAYWNTPTMNDPRFSQVGIWNGQYVEFARVWAGYATTLDNVDIDQSGGNGASRVILAFRNATLGTMTDVSQANPSSTATMNAPQVTATKTAVFSLLRNGATGGSTAPSVGGADPSYSLGAAATGGRSSCWAGYWAGSGSSPDDSFDFGGIVDGQAIVVLKIEAAS